MLKAEVRGLLDLAEESIAAAELLLKARHYRFSVSRAYYAMFYVAEALHCQEERAYSSHSAVIAEFGRHFVKSGRFHAKFHDHLRRAFQDRQRGDYDPADALSKKTAELTLRRAQEFLDVASEFLKAS